MADIEKITGQLEQTLEPQKYRVLLATGQVWTIKAHGFEYFTHPKEYVQFTGETGEPIKGCCLSVNALHGIVCESVIDRTEADDLRDTLRRIESRLDALEKAITAQS